MDLKSISIEELQREIEERNKVEYLFEKNGKKYYSVDQYNRLLNYFDEHGQPENFTPIEFNANGTAKSAEPQHVVINVEGYFSNRVFKDETSFHVVTDTRTIRESESGSITSAFVDEYVFTKDKKALGGFAVERSTVSREDFLKNYKDAFGVNDMISLLKIVDANSAKLSAGSATLSLDGM